MRLHGGLSRSRPTLGDERGSDSPERAIAFRETDRADRRRADDTYGDERGASLLTGGRVLGNQAVGKCGKSVIPAGVGVPLNTALRQLRRGSL